MLKDTFHMYTLYNVTIIEKHFKPNIVPPHQGSSPAVSSFVLVGESVKTNKEDTDPL